MITLKETKKTIGCRMYPIDRDLRMKINSHFQINLQEDFVNPYTSRDLLEKILGYENIFDSKEKMIELVLEWLEKNAILEEDFYWFVIDGKVYGSGGTALKMLRKGVFDVVETKVKKEEPKITWDAITCFNKESLEVRLDKTDLDLLGWADYYDPEKEGGFIDLDWSKDAKDIIQYLFTGDASEKYEFSLLAGQWLEMLQK